VKGASTREIAVYWNPLATCVALTWESAMTGIHIIFELIALFAYPTRPRRMPSQAKTPFKGE
jgi:hypothetical protein